jgi:vancomycin resistance protein YoaR
VANIKNAANRINTYGSFTDGYVMQPGEIFSFNDTVGERTEANGFSMATVYTTSGTASDVGGGICQVSSTIFSAIFKADLEVTSRTNHMYIVHYWNTDGEDATVNWGTIDFKFQNNKSYPIKIKLSVDTNKGSITCKVYGTDDGYRAEFDNKVLKITLAGVVTKKATTSNPAGTVEYGDPGKVVEIYKVRYYNDVKISKELMWTSTYVPLDTVKYQ